MIYQTSQTLSTQSFFLLLTAAGKGHRHAFRRDDLGLGPSLFL